ncbi:MULTISPECIES: sensor histidine kinase [unclassified Microbacterium]|uniref:sensor histidine kinase n=1 Tax=unclassified Microbacterium TaxID=2609290 RepID=UPI00137D4DED|nr:ATP-binding protein [Microbacterium sp. MAH-37]MVQ41078.1 ATP-binding protein [Microbacterium sp. MAH-37]
MAVDARGIREAWNQIPSPGAAGSGLERFTGNRMERILQIVIALGSAALGAQAFLGAIGTMSSVDAAHLAILNMVFLPLVCMIVACLAGRFVRVACGSFAVSYMFALLLWPVVVISAGRGASEQPWIFFLVNIGVVAAVAAFPFALQFVWAAALPLVYGWVRLVQGGFSQEYWITTAFDVTFTLILGMVLVSLAWMFRSVAAGVDEARAKAVDTYASAAAATAAEEERVALAALMHDSVLAALIAAARAESEREQDLAVGMAREALTRLANTEASVAQEGSDEPVSTTGIVSELRRTLSEQGADAVVEERGEPGAVPGKVARALVLAARQAIGNALTHAAGRGLHVVVEEEDPGIRIVVSDTGPGFDLEHIGEDRLGIRASILARMAAVAGTADISSGDWGTVVTLGWDGA